MAKRPSPRICPGCGSMGVKAVETKHECLRCGKIGRFPLMHRTTYDPSAGGIRRAVGDGTYQRPHHKTDPQC